MPIEEKEEEADIEELVGKVWSIRWKIINKLSKKIKFSILLKQNVK